MRSTSLRSSKTSKDFFGVSVAALQILVVIEIEIVFEIAGA